jgi:hypothetical protein
MEQYCDANDAAMHTISSDWRLRIYEPSHSIRWQLVVFNNSNRGSMLRSGLVPASASYTAHDGYS